MSEGSERDRDPESGGENVGTSDILDEAATGADRADPTQGTPPIEGGGRPGQTQTPAPAEETGVPEDLDDRTD